MQKLKIYFFLAWNNILRNKLFSLFCVVVSALTCIFMYVILQISSVIHNDTPPFSNSDRVISFLDEFYDTEGRFLDGVSAPYIKTFVQGLRNYEKISISNTEFTSVFVGSKVIPTEVAFVDNNYFTVNDFDFIDGRPFTQQETWDVAKLAVISEKMALRCFNNNSVIGEKLEVQGNVYTIVGMVQDYSIFSTVKEVVNIWLPYSTNKFMPSGETVYNIDILFPENVSKEEFKQDYVFAMQTFFKNRGFELDLSINQVKTLKEIRMERYGNNGLYVGVGVIIFLLVLTPAINIITLGESSTQNRIIEFAVRRATGATKRSIFYLIMIENFILVGLGFVIGILSAYPMISWIESVFFRSLADGTSTTLLTGSISIYSILVLIPLCVIFSFISGGIPAYMIARQNMSVMLKGGSND